MGMCSRSRGYQGVCGRTSAALPIRQDMGFNLRESELDRIEVRDWREGEGKGFMCAPPAVRWRFRTSGLLRDREIAETTNHRPRSGGIQHCFA